MAIAVLSAAMCCLSFDANAGVRVSGSKDAMRIEAQNASPQDIVLAMNSAFSLQIELPAYAEQAISGTYSGSARQVLARMLDGHSYVVQTSGSRIVVTFMTPGMPGAAVRVRTDGRLPANNPIAASADDDTAPRSGSWGWQGAPGSVTPSR